MVIHLISPKYISSRSW